MVRQGHLIALVVAFLVGCAFLLVAGASGVQAQASNKEEARCQGTRNIKLWSLGGDIYTTNDLPGCSKGGLLLGTDKSDTPPARPSLAGQDGDDLIRGLGGSDSIEGGTGDDVIYGGDGDDYLLGREGKDVIYGGDGNDTLISNNYGQQGDKLYCGEGKDRYKAGPNDYVDSSCENRQIEQHQGHNAPDVGPASVMRALGLDHSYSASASPVPVPPSGGAAILLPAVALLLGSGTLTYAILRRR